MGIDPIKIIVRRRFLCQQHFSVEQVSFINFFIIICIDDFAGLIAELLHIKCSQLFALQFSRFGKIETKTNACFCITHCINHRAQPDNWVGRRKREADLGWINTVIKAFYAYIMAIVVLTMNPIVIIFLIFVIVHFC